MLEEKTLVQSRQFYDEGMELRASRDFNNAMARFQAAINLDPAFEDAWVAMGEVFLADGYFLHAMDHYGRGIGANPDSIILKDRFISLLRSGGFRVFNPRLKELITFCLDSEDVDFFRTGPAWHSLLIQDPDFAAIRVLYRQKSYPEFARQMESAQGAIFWNDPYFLRGLKKVLVPDLDFERFLTYLRRWLLERQPEGHEDLAAALAHYCFLNGYVFDISDDEKSRVARLRKAIESQAQPVWLHIALLGCYHPLDALSNAALIAESFPSSLTRQQITDRKAQEDIRAALPKLTPISEGVSSDVRNQYEEYPYPRWTAFTKEIANEEHEGFLRNGRPVILNAGCGTGREAIELADHFPQADVLAVDLSSASLAYAIERASHFGVKNVRFMQGDILRLGGIPERFDFIASSGVLHHMADPFAGWRILSDLLKPGGTMRIGLYSERARAPVVSARRVIAREGYADGSEAVRRFRRDIKKRLRKKDWQAIAQSMDFYSMQECRDLLFHVQEHRYTLPMVKEHLDRLGLNFSGFHLDNNTLLRFDKKSGRPRNDLDAWDRYERKYPETFRLMYRFWCKKPAGAS